MDGAATEEPLLDAKVLAISEALRGASIPHAFGGAIALAYWATPRGTEDIDLNVFWPVERADHVLEALAPLGVESRGEPVDETGHALLARWGHTPIHLFFAYDAFHERCAERRREVPFGGRSIEVLAAEDIALFKLVYDRPKDRVEVRELLLCMGERLDADYLLDWLIRMVGEGDPRVARLREQLGGALREGRI